VKTACRKPLIENELGAVFLLFFFLTSIRIAISLFFQSPWIFADETVYAETARNILHGEFYSRLLYCQTYPPGYSLFLSFAYLITDSTLVAYHVMLIINAVLASSVIFPAYAILKKFCPGTISLPGAFFVAILPSITLYNFVIMSENLFIPLFTFSLWFLLESFETGSRKWGILAGLSIFLLFFTRTPGIAMIIGFFVALIYHALKQHRTKNLYLLLKDYLPALAAFGIPALLWTIYKSFTGMAVISGYSNDVYISSVFRAVSDPRSFAQYLFLAFHEMEFLILASYIIFFVLTLSWIYELLRHSPVQDRFQTDEHITLLSTWSAIIYVLVSSFILVVITITHMFAAIVFYGDISYYIFGRYIDPIIPIIVLSGIIGFYGIWKKQFSESKKIVLACISLNLCLAIPFLLDFPHAPFKFSNMFSLFYLKSLADLTSSYLFILIFVCIISCLFAVGIYYKKLWYLLFISLAIFSIFGMHYTLQKQLFFSSATYESNRPVADYLAIHTNESQNILMSPDDYHSEYGIMTWYATQFFTEGYLIQTNNTLTGPQPVSYILSKKILLKNVISVSGTGFKLYDTSERTRSTVGIPYTIHPVSEGDKTENFYQDGWTKNSSGILVEYPAEAGDMNLTVTIKGIRPGDNPAIVVLSCNDRALRTVTFMGGYETVSVQIPEQYLHDYFQVLRIDTNTWRPSDYGSTDSRDLGVQIGEISVRAQKNVIQDTGQNRNPDHS